MSREQPLRLVVFDMAGVLVDVLPWSAAHAACGYPEDRLPTLDRFLPRMSELNHDYDRGRLSVADYESLAAQASEDRYSVEDVRAIHAAQLGKEFSGISDLFDALDAVPGLEIAVLSNTNPAHWQRIEHIEAGVARYPSLMRAHHRVASFRVGVAKPDPAIYDTFVRLVGIDPRRVIFFDDLIGNVDAARAVGWTAERIDPGAGDVAGQLRQFLRAHLIIEGRSP